MWRDEYEEFLQARDAGGLFGLGNTMSQGHAMLWQGCLWILTRFTHNPLVMQVFHGCIAAAFAWFLLNKSPFKLWQNALLLGGYFFLFEYALISRCYAFGVLFFMVAAWLYTSQKKLSWKLAICLFLLANTSIYAMMLTGVFVAWLFVYEVLLVKIDVKQKLFSYLPMLGFAALGILIAYLQIRPQADNSFPVHRVIWPIDPYRLDTALTQFFTAFVPISKFQNAYFWNTNFLMDSKGVVQWWLAAIVFVIVTLPFVKQPKLLLLWLAGAGLVVFFQYHTGFRFARYYGHIFLWWLLCLWLLKSLIANDAYTHGVFKYLFPLVLLVQLFGGVSMYTADWMQKFSRGPEVAKWLKRHGYANNYMIASVDFAMSPIAAELDRKIYYMQHKALCSFTKWDKARINSTYEQDWMDAIANSGSKKPIILITNHPVPEFQYFRIREAKLPPPREFMFNKYKVTALAYFRPGIEYYEGYWVFKIQNP